MPAPMTQRSALVFCVSDVVGIRGVVSIQGDVLLDIGREQSKRNTVRQDREVRRRSLQPCGRQFMARRLPWRNTGAVGPIACGDRTPIYRAFAMPTVFSSGGNLA